MFFLTESSFDLNLQLAELAASVTDHGHGRKIVLNTDIGSGHFKTVDLGNGLKIVLTDYTVNRNFSKVYDNSRADAYCLHINQVKATEKFSVLINGKEIFFNNKLYASVFMVCHSEPFEVKTTPGTYFNQLKIVIPKEWPAQHLADLYDEAVLKQYIDLQEERLYFDSLDTVYLKLVNRLVNEVEHISYLPLVQGIVTIIIQRFFFRMAAKLYKRGE
ncbi:MAG TPA: hypothetical protein VGM41_02360 [Chitinophagaceae bacterium]|jgi:hypothetical protein